MFRISIDRIPRRVFTTAIHSLRARCLSFLPCRKPRECDPINQNQMFLEDNHGSMASHPAEVIASIKLPQNDFSPRYMKSDKAEKCASRVAVVGNLPDGKSHAIRALSADRNKIPERCECRAESRKSLLKHSLVKRHAGVLAIDPLGSLQRKSQVFC